MQAEPTALKVDFGAPPEIPQAAIDRVAELLSDGRLHRYAEARNVGEDVASLEVEFAASIGRKYAGGLNSCGSTMFLSLLTTGVKPGDKVLMSHLQNCSGALNFPAG